MKHQIFWDVSSLYDIVLEVAGDFSHLAVGHAINELPYFDNRFSIVGDNTGTRVLAVRSDVQVMLYLGGDAYSYYGVSYTSDYNGTGTPVRPA